MDNQLFREVAISAVKKAGKILNENLQKVEEMSFKGKSDIVTNVDLESEKSIIEKLRTHFPDHGILSEEAGLSNDNSSEYLWIMDPIDGTTNYYYGMNPFRVALCLLYQKSPLLSAIYNPTKDELYVAQKGQGATLNDKKIIVSDNTDLHNSVVMFHLSSKKEPRLRTLQVLEKIFEESMHMRMYGSSLASMSYIASGKFDAYFNVQSKIWDILPGAFLIQEAGGKATDIHGKEIGYESTSVLATNGKIHDKMLELLKNI